MAMGERGGSSGLHRKTWLVFPCRREIIMKDFQFSRRVAGFSPNRHFVAHINATFCVVVPLIKLAFTNFYRRLN